MSRSLLGGIELGGTKCVCLIGTGADDIRARISIPTGSSPEDTLQHLEDALRNGMSLHGPIASLGIACFGPLDIAKDSASYGNITRTAKPGWTDTSVARRLARTFKVPVGFNTDVNGAALAEGRWGAARGLNDYAYITVGTGVGVGLIVGGQAAGGFTHSEIGHIRVARQRGDSFPGSCVFHGDCVEGLASGVAIAARAGVPADQVGVGDSLWTPVAHTLAQLLHTLVLTTAPRRILIGGGVIQSRPELLALVRQQLSDSLNGYIDIERLTGGLEHYVLPPGLGALAGPLGALALAADAI
jgi:fructokinase